MRHTAALRHQEYDLENHKGEQSKTAGIFLAPMSWFGDVKLFEGHLIRPFHWRHLRARHPKWRKADRRQEACRPSVEAADERGARTRAPIGLVK